MTFSSRRLGSYFLLVFSLSAVFWLIGAMTDAELSPGIPISALMFVCPAAGALILIYRDDGLAGATRLLKRCFDCRRIRAPIWYVPIVLLMPVMTLLSYGAMRLLGSPLPAVELPFAAAPIMLLAFFVAALGEELGWSGYAIDPMQQRWSAIGASLLLGAIWAAWHVVPLLQTGRGYTWIAWWCLLTVALRVLHTWIYNNTGKSVFGVALFHAVSNASWQLFPNRGSHWDPRVTGLVVVLTVVIVTIVWGRDLKPLFAKATSA